MLFWARKSAHVTFILGVDGSGETGIGRSSRRYGILECGFDGHRLVAPDDSWNEATVNMIHMDDSASTRMDVA